MKRGLLLVASGFLICVVSIGWWQLTRPQVEAGDAPSVERALTTPTTTALSADPVAPPQTETAPQTEAAPLPTPPLPTIPRFTISEQAQRDDRVPVGLQIPALEVEAPIVPVGVESNGDMEVPDSVSDVGWYKHGSAPGQPGSAVLAAHVDLASQGPGVFFDLRTLEPGDVIYVVFDDGTSDAFRAEARTIYGKTELPVDAIFSRQGSPVLTLITCGGGFNRSLQSYDSNVVVYAVPLDVDPNNQPEGSA
jgi:hypothetical protein